MSRVALVSTLALLSADAWQYFLKLEYDAEFLLSDSYLFCLRLAICFAMISISLMIESRIFSLLADLLPVLYLAFLSIAFFSHNFPVFFDLYLHGHLGDFAGIVEDYFITALLVNVFCVTGLTFNAAWHFIRSGVY